MRVAMVVHSAFPDDPRVRKEAFALRAEGHDVDVVCLRHGDEAARETVGGVTVRRLAVSRRRGRGRLGYLAEYARFFVLASATLAALDREKPLDVVHAHTIPDQLVYTALAPRRHGARVVLDLHDPMPELFVDKYGRTAGGRWHALLARLQSAACDYADHVIVSSEPFKERLVERGVLPEKVTVVINGPEEPAWPDPFVLVYHGSLFDRYDLATVLRGMALATDRLPSAQLLVFGSDVDPAYVRRMQELTEELGLGGRVSFSGRISAAAIRCVLASADLGVVPARPSPHMDLVYSTKLLEYLSAGLPVLAARTPPLERRFGEALRYYSPEDPVDFAAGLVAHAEAAGQRRERNARRSALPDDMRWEEIAPVAVRAITGGGRTAPNPGKERTRPADRAARPADRAGLRTAPDSEGGRV